ncbi:MAG: tRNA pseudouridine(38-40) synthase TruA [Lachnospiraceae bacterium]|nr:tRNA pseudouridine(38-40) synthase TruA [Lachnospiraceae bacterium]
MKRVKLTISYDGTRYCGWQVQNNGPTVEEAVTLAVKKVTGEDVKLLGASRTDAGVHALGNVAVFDTSSPVPADKFCFALNSYLPEDIVVLDSCEVAADFHPRHCESRKTYEYRIRNTRFPLATDRLYTHHVHKKLDTEAMRRAAAFVTGEHDFTSFCSVGAQVESKVRTVYSLDILEDGGVITLRICGNGFLYNMVRIIAGTLIEVGLGLRDPEGMGDVILGMDRNLAGPTAPAKGLTLIKIEFL